MKLTNTHWLMPLALSLLLLLSACGGKTEDPAPETNPPPPSQTAEEASGDAPQVLSLARDEAPSYLTCRLIDGAEEGNLLLAALDQPLCDGHEGLHDGRSVYRLPLAEDTAIYLDGEPAGADALWDGMPLEISFNGTVLESFPAQLGEVYELHGFSIGSRQCPGGDLYDLCGLYLQALDDLWQRDPALNEDIALAALDLSRAPGDLLESEKSALAWRFGETHGVEVLTLTLQELAEQGYLEDSGVSTPAPEEGEDFSALWYRWPDGCFFSITPNEGHVEEIYSLPTLFFDVQKWTSPLSAYVLYDCSAVWPAMGTWGGSYQIGSEMIS